MKIICTLGPSSYKDNVLSFLKNKVNIFRINLSHTPKEQIINKIKYLKNKKIKNICIDTEGAQLRTNFILKKTYIKKGEYIKVFNNKKNCNINTVSLHPSFELKKIRLNSKIYIGFNSLILKVIKNETNKEYILTKVISPGMLETNKGVHISNNFKLNPLTEKDRYALKLAKNYNIKYFAISFVNRSEDLKQVKKILNKNSFIISKIETLNAINDLKNISKESNALLIDRGDLSRYIPIEKIPYIQEQIIKFAKKNKIPIYVATNLLETMINAKEPTRAESNDIYTTLKQGANGLVLAAETAIGIDPVNCVNFLNKCIQLFKKNKNLKIL